VTNEVSEEKAKAPPLARRSLQERGLPLLLQSSITSSYSQRAIDSAPSSDLGAAARPSPRSVTTGATPGAPAEVWSSELVNVGAVAVDYLTLTTYSAEAFSRAVELIHKHTPREEMRGARLMQYTGYKGGNYFYGSGIQVDQEHYLLRLSGSASHYFLEAALASPGLRGLMGFFNCTRIDVQYTHPEQFSGIDLPGVCEYLRLVEWPKHRGKRPAVEMFNSDDGLHTLYIGSRSSPRFQRLYVKEVDGLRLLRYEVEYKGSGVRALAAKLYAVIVDQGLELLVNVLVGEFDQLPLGDEFAPLAAALTGPPSLRLKIVKDPSSTDKTLRWLSSSVASAIRRLRSRSEPWIDYWLDQFLGSGLYYVLDSTPLHPGYSCKQVVDSLLL